MNFEKFQELIAVNLDPIKKTNPHFGYAFDHNVCFDIISLLIWCRVPFFELGEIYKFEKFGLNIPILPYQYEDFDESLIKMIYIKTPLNNLKSGIGDIYLNQNFEEYQLENKNDNK